MAEPPRNSAGPKLLLGLLAIAVAALVAVFVLHSLRAPRPRAPTPATAAAPAPASQAPPAPLPPPPLSRAELIAAAGAAASAYAAGDAPGPGAATLVGRRFKLTLPFGCEGPRPAADETWASWDYGPNRKTLKITVRAQDWTPSAFAGELGAPDEVEAVEGFWIPRPWTTSEACTMRKPDPLEAAPPAPSNQTLGLAMLFRKGGSRVRRRAEQPFELVVKLPENGSAPAPEGFRLLLEGRVVGFPGGDAVRCRGAGPDQRPVCLVGADIERVRILNPATGEPLGEWRG